MALLLCAVPVVATHAGPPPCSADVDGNGDVGFPDLLEVLSNWGPCPGCAADLTGDGEVGFPDLLEVLSNWGPCPAGDIRAIDLAGNALGRYPFVEFVRAFEEGAGVRVAIDPANVPEGDQTADVYVVAARNEAQWSGDPALVDVRGAPQTETFDGSTIQANTRALTGSTLLSGDAGTGLGVGYDLVCDFNRNGVLDGGDLIDGLADEAGFSVVRDLVLPGPLAVSELTYSVAAGSVTPGFLQENTFYPTNIASMGRLPLITISHGNGHQYTWYDYLAAHLASYGYIVMSHANNTVPGIETASTTTYQHTDAFLGQLDTIGGGVLQGHVDDGRITWIGHSRGGEGVARAYTRVATGAVTPAHYAADDIVLVSSIAPNNALGPGVTEPGRVNYHLIWGAADGDISGSGSSTGTWSFAIFERAAGFRQSTYIHGADHNDFNCCGFDDFDGPAGTAIGRDEAQRVAKAVYLALVKRYVEGNAPALDFLWRQYERLRPDSISTDTVVVSDYREAVDAASFVIDDYQTQTSPATSSSGGAVTTDVQNLVEGQLRDLGSGYSWNGSDPMNGMSRATSGDDARGAVFDWSAGTDRFLELAVIAAERDFSDDVYLSLRACQGTQHPETVAELDDLTFSVTLRDGSGAASTIEVGAYGGGIEEVYQRTGGWQNEFEVVRIRLRDFLHNGSGLDLTDIEAVRLDFGAAFGAARGRIGLDDVSLSSDAAPRLAGAIAITLPNGAPALLAPGEATVFDVRIDASSETVVPGTATLHHRSDGGAYLTTPLAEIGGDLYEAELPAAACADSPEFYITAEGSKSGETSLPLGAPADVFAAEVGVTTTVFQDDFETEQGWTVENVDLTDGGWDRGVPVGGGDRGDPPTDYDGSGQCRLTDNEDDNSDVDGGPTRLISPTIDVTSLADPLVSYARWFTNDDNDIDRLTVEISNDDGASWVQIESVANSSGWQVVELRIADFVTPSAQMRLRFSATDNPNDSVTEAGVDAVRVFAIECE